MRSTSSALPLPGLLVLAAALVVTAPPAASTAHAQTPEATARSHYERGTNLYNLGQFDEAIAEYRKGYEVKADPTFLFNIAQSFRQLGAHDKALFFYKRYLSTHPTAANRSQVEERIAQLEPLVAVHPVPTSPSPSAEAAPPQMPSAGPSAPPAPAGTTPGPPELTEVSVKPTEPAPPVWRRWWFWTAVGGAVIVGAVGVALAVSREGTSVPPTDLGSKRFSF